MSIGRAVDPALVGVDVQVAAVEQLPPQLAPARQVVREEVARTQAEELLARGAVLRQHRVVDPRHALVLEHIVEQPLLVAPGAPLDRLVEHHEEEAVERLREQKLSR